MTAFFDIGSFQKGEHQTFTPDKYTHWMSTFQYIDNPVYAFFDADKNAEDFRKIRTGPLKNKTKIVVLDRETLWAFKLKPNISDIFSNPDYPKYNPNTVNADYSCAMHAKYEVVQKVAKENTFNTKYIAWLDIGYFRDMNETNNFHIHLPPKFAGSKVAYNQVFDAWHRTLEDIMHNNEIWVGGGFFIAEVSVMSKWVEDYMHYTEEFIKHKLINTDQQVIYSMIQPPVRKKFGKRRVAIQPYRGSKPSKWLYLGHLCKQ